MAARSDMLIVSIDTAGKNGSIGLFGCDVASGGIITSAGDIETLTGGAYSAELIPKLAELLKRSNHAKTDIDAFVVASGPGSFTGLRVGLSTVKALADALDKPIAAVSVLEAVARKSGAQGRFVVALDAGRKQVYVADFEGDSRDGIGTRYQSLRERLLDLSVFSAELRNDSPLIATPDLDVADALRSAGGNVRVVPRPTASDYAVLGAELIRDGQTITPAELDANYIRRSDAELFKAPR